MFNYIKYEKVLLLNKSKCFIKKNKKKKKTRKNNKWSICSQKVEFISIFFRFFAKISLFFLLLNNLFKKQIIIDIENTNHK